MHLSTLRNDKLLADGNNIVPGPEEERNMASNGHHRLPTRSSGLRHLRVAPTGKGQDLHQGAQVLEKLQKKRPRTRLSEQFRQNRTRAKHRFKLHSQRNNGKSNVKLIRKDKA